MPIQSAATLRRLTQEIAEALGTPSDLAEAVVDSLVGANLAGHDSHGVLRVPWYATLIRNGQIVADARPKVASTRGATARIDGGSGWGQPTARLAARTAIDLATEHGVGAVMITNGNHIGRLGEYVEMIARAGKVGLMHCNASAIVAPFGGYQRVMGTNPFAWAAPAGPGREPLVLDFATSIVAEGKLRVARAKGDKLAPGLIVDADGRPSETPDDFYDGGALLPFGLHKGSGMSVMIELLARGLTGVDHGLPSNQGYNGTVVIALDIAAFAPVEQFEAAAERLCEQIGGSTPSGGYERVLLPGEPERIARRDREANGISLPDATWNELTALATELGIAI